MAGLYSVQRPYALRRHRRQQILRARMSVPMVRSPSGSVMLNFYRVVGVAQLVERRSVAPNVAGSIPVSHPTNIQ